MILPLSLLGFFLSVLLLYFNARKYPSSIYLSIFFLTISIYGIIQHTVLYSKSKFLIGIVFINVGFLSYLIGPMFYWYIRSVLTDNASLKKTYVLHFLPMLIFLAFSFPHIFTPWSHKIEIAQRIIEDAKYAGLYNRSLFFNIPSTLIFLSRPILLIAYVAWSLLLLLRYKKENKMSLLPSHHLQMTKWFFVLFSCVFVLILSHMLQIVQIAVSQSIIFFYTINALQVFSGLSMTGLLLSPFFFPSVLYGLPRAPKSTDSKDDAQDTDPGIEQKNTIRFETDYLVFIQQVTEAGMKELKPYLEVGCNLASFSKIVQIPSHHLAYYFKEVKKQSFNDYRNEWRVNHAKTLIMEGKASGITLDAIGAMSGFSSKNTFYTVFKKTEGVTPGEYVVRYSQENTSK